MRVFGVSEVELISIIVSVCRLYVREREEEKEKRKIE